MLRFLLLIFFFFFNLWAAEQPEQDIASFPIKDQSSSQSERGQWASEGLILLKLASPNPVKTVGKEMIY